MNKKLIQLTHHYYQMAYQHHIRVRYYMEKLHEVGLGKIDPVVKDEIEAIDIKIHHFTSKDRLSESEWEQLSDLYETKNQIVEQKAYETDQE